jgi:YidC/Oxa1 family membrane protein insertase
VEKRLVIFLTASVLIMTGYGFLRMQFAPPPPADQEIAQELSEEDEGSSDDDQASDGADSETAHSDQPAAEREDAGDDSLAVEETAEGDSAEQPAQDRPRPAVPDVAQQWLTLGSFSADSPYRLLVVFTNRGAAVQRVELVERRGNGQLRYRELTERHGYLGCDFRNTDSGCEVTVVGPGTPAAGASPVAGTDQPGLLAGDLIQQVNGLEILSAEDLDAMISDSKPGEQLTVRLARPGAAGQQPLEFSIELGHRPLALIHPEAPRGESPSLSYLLGIQSLGQQEARFDQDELEDLRSLRNTNWEVLDHTEDEVVFRQRVPVGAGDEAGELEFVKRYRLVPTPQEGLADHANPSYHLELNVDVRNTGTQPQKLSFNMDGANGLPVEGWWYSNKIHPSWGSAGARDVIWRVHDQRHSLRSAAEIYKQAKKNPEDPVKTILTDNPDPEQRTLDYLGVDTQYFSAVLMAGSAGEPQKLRCQQAYALPVKPVPELEKRAVRTLNTTYRFVSEPLELDPEETISQQFHVFLGPKSPDLLERYGLSDIIEYGWFGWIAKPLGHLLHLFYMFVRNYGLAIVLLTVLVRGCMFPIGRKAARNAQVMQELAPEIKKIKDKYKNDMEKQAQAQRELWKKHNFNPLGGCWLMFLQLPIFIGLYRCLSVDIELREASLIPGIRWCSNLAGPDMFLYWNTSGLEFLTSKTGWLGPYLNILPIVTVILFLMQQKMFTPPATDDQTRMQQKMMKYMMVFMGVLFFKVPSGLCIYFIASSIWGIAERKLLPKPEAKPANDEPPKKGKVQTLVDRLKDKAEPETGDEIRARRKKRRKQ